MAITDKTTWLMGDEIFLHECDNCSNLLDGDPFFHWKDKDFTLCLSCYYSLNESKNSREKNFTTKPQKVKIPNDLKWEIWERDNFTCQYCQSRKQLSIDHVFPESLGGTLDKSNLVTACIKCNILKGARTPEKARMTLLNDPRSGVNHGPQEDDRS